MTFIVYLERQLAGMGQDFETFRRALDKQDCSCPEPHPDRGAEQFLIANYKAWFDKHWPKIKETNGMVAFRIASLGVTSSRES